ncbi:MAG: hypothetical protein R2778_18985 [Saprospiraceae bacterium]|nr:hypothetical protein [Saprospiraceae bacterium]MCB9342843.1 hypothetical protein [Lewinellaceae bacterium]
MADIQFPLNETQIALLKLSENLSEEELQDLKRLIIALKAQRLSQLANKVWDEKGWTQETMEVFLKTHMRTPYKTQQVKP